MKYWHALVILFYLNSFIALAVPVEHALQFVAEREIVSVKGNEAKMLLASWQKAESIGFAAELLKAQLPELLKHSTHFELQLRQGLENKAPYSYRLVEGNIKKISLDGCTEENLTFSLIVRQEKWIEVHDFHFQKKIKCGEGSMSFGNK